jgi:hypothetical protein
LLREPNQLNERVPMEVGSGKEQANPSYAAGAGKGQENGRGHCLLSAAKLTAIVHYAYYVKRSARHF